MLISPSRAFYFIITPHHHIPLHYITSHPVDFTCPFIRWVNNKLKWYTSHHYLIFSIIFLSNYYAQIHKMLLDHGGNHPCEKPGTFNAMWWSDGVITHVSRKTKSRRKHVLFLWTVKFMLSICNMFHNLSEITRFWKHIDGLLTDMQIPRHNILTALWRTT